jgi:hypothetical protein
MSPRPDTTLMMSTVYTSHLTMGNVVNPSVAISFTTGTVVPLTYNERQRRSCYRQRNIQIKASQWHLACKNWHYVIPQNGTHVPKRVGEADLMFVLNNLLRTKRSLLYIRNQSVPRCKHFPPSSNSS